MADRGPVNIDDPRIILPPKDEVYKTIEGTIQHFKIVMEGLKLPAGEVYSYTEGGNGELGFYLVSDGSGTPYRVRIRPPCFSDHRGLERVITGRHDGRRCAHFRFPEHDRRRVRPLSDSDWIVIMQLQDRRREIPFEPGETIIRAAQKSGIDIPHYCWHPGLSVAANCRMCLVEILPPPGRPAMTLIPTPGGQHIVERRGGYRSLQRRFGGSAYGSFSVQLSKQEIVGPCHLVMDYRIDFDHVLIAGQHQGLFRPALEAAGAMRHIPLIGGRFGLARGRARSKTDLDHAHAAALHARQALHGPRQFIMQARLLVG